MIAVVCDQCRLVMYQIDRMGDASTGEHLCGDCAEFRAADETEGEKT